MSEQAVRVDLVPGRLAARVQAHDFPAGPERVPCWTYVSDGLSSAGQKELIFTLRRRPDEAPADFPHDPLRFFTQVLQLAEQGRLVDVGGFTAFRAASGFLGETEQLALVYTTPEALPGVALPPPGESLLAVLLRPDEAAVVPAIGGYRALSLLGQARRYYPTPPWSDRDRPAVLTQADLAQSVLSRVSTWPATGLTVRMLTAPPQPVPGRGVAGLLPDAEMGRPGDVVLRVPAGRRAALREALAQAGAGGGLALLTTPDPEADVRLVWRPDQGQPCAIQAGGDGRCVTGSFLMLAFGEGLTDGARVAEDGFAAMFGPESWRRFGEALAAGAPLRVPPASADLQGFALEPLPDAAPVRPADGPPAFAVASFLFYQPDEVQRERIANLDVFADYLKAVMRTAADYWAARPAGPPQYVTLVLALRPGGRSRFWAEYDPGGVDAEAAAGLLRALEALPAPLVRNGPVAIAAHATLWRAPTDAQGKHAFIPEEWQRAVAGREALIPDDALDVVWPDEGQPQGPQKRWWQFWK
jgi:hypothetical protein